MKSVIKMDKTIRELYSRMCGRVWSPKDTKELTNSILDSMFVIKSVGKSWSPYSSATTASHQDQLLKNWEREENLLHFVYRHIPHKPREGSS